MSLSRTSILFGSLGAPRDVGIRFTGVSGLSGSAIAAATLTFRASATDTGSFVGDWYAHDATAPGEFTSTTSNISDTAQRPRTTATCEGDGSDFGDWTVDSDETFIGDGTNTIADIIQELANSYDPSTIALLHIYTSGDGERSARSYDGDAGTATKLVITHTAGGGSTQTATPDPVVIPIAIPDPKLALTPDPVVIPIAIPLPAITGGTTIFPEPVVIPIAIPAPALSAGAVTLTPDPVDIPVVITTPVISGAGAAEEFTQWGLIQRFTNPAQYALGTLYFIEVGMFTSSASVPVKARLFNVSDGVVVAGSEAQTTETGYDVVRSGTFSLPSGLKKYRLEYGGQQGGVFSFHGGDVLPESAGS